MVRNKAGPCLQGFEDSTRRRGFYLSVGIQHQRAMGR